MTRVASGASMVLLAVVTVWFAPPLVFLIVAEILLLLGTIELGRLARASGLALPVWPAWVAAALACASFSNVIPGRLFPLDAVLLASFVALAALATAAWRGDGTAIGSASAALLPSLYLGLPLGAMVAIRETRGAAVLFLLMLTVMVSDTSQYYAGRVFGRRPLAPAISPKKTIEGAIGGLVAGPLCFALAGVWWLPEATVGLRVAVGVIVVALGIAGDLFESMLKRSAGVKDSAGWIPGHGGVLDRIDALLFAAPVYYIVFAFGGALER